MSLAPSRRQGSSRLEAAVVAASLLAFLFFGVAWIRLPGPQQDELAYVPVVLSWLRADVPFSPQLLGRHFPLMVQPYAGALKGWLLWLWFQVVPIGVPGYRLFAVALGLLTVCLVFWFVRRYYDRPIALLTAALVATDPSFIHTIRLDWGPVALMHVLKMGSLCLLSLWLSSGSCLTLCSATFLFGLGLWDKVTFLWLLAGFGLTIALLFPRRVWNQLRTRASQSPLALLALLLGASPLIYHSLVQQGGTWREHSQIDIRWSKLYQAKGTFEGTFVPALTGEQDLDASPPAHDVVFPRLANWMYTLGRARRTIQLPLLALAVLFLPLNLWIARRTAPDRTRAAPATASVQPAGASATESLWTRRLLFPLLASVLIYACMFVTPQGGGSVHHVIMLQPFPLLFLATSLWLPAERWPRLPLRAAAVLVAGAAIAVNLSLNARHLAIYTRTGGTGGFTDAVYRLVPFLERNPEWKLYAMDWGFSHPVELVGRSSKLDVTDFFFELWDPQSSGHAEALERLRRLMRDPNSVFLLHSPQRTLVPGPARDFFQLAETSGIQMRRIASFRERSGQEVYEVYRNAN